VFPDSRITEISRYGPAGPRPEGMVMVVGFELFGREFYALNGGPNARIEGAGVSLMVECETQEELGVTVSVFAQVWVGGQLCSGVGDGLAEGHAGGYLGCGWVESEVVGRMVELAAKR